MQAEQLITVQVTCWDDTVEDGPRLVEGDLAW